MAKRRKLTAPSAEQLNQIEAEFRRETSPNPGMAPIAQVAAENAMNVNVTDPVTRAKLAELERHHAVEAQGLVARLIPIDMIDASAITRDRMELDAEEFAELKASILASGLRMPIEVFALEQQEGAARYGLISGYRRLRAVQELRGQPGQGDGVIEALIRPAGSAAKSMEAMVEENEIRADLSQYERGRIVVLAAQNGVYSDVEEATTKLFAFASKAKRSKIRSFALIFEQLGDVLSHPQALTEKQGLILSRALRDGAGGLLRDGLAQSVHVTAPQEWAEIQQALAGLATTSATDKPARGGRPKAESQTIETDRGTQIGLTRKATGAILKIDRPLDDAAVEKLLGYLSTEL